MPLTETDINGEKAAKVRPDLVPPRATLAAARALTYGVAKHGGGTTGYGTFRDAGTEQSRAETHIASFDRHWLRFKAALRRGVDAPVDPDSGLLELDCAAAQLAIVVDLVEDPPEPREIDPEVPMVFTITPGPTPWSPEAIECVRRGMESMR